MHKLTTTISKQLIAETKESIHVISMLENIPQPCRGFGKDTVSCKCFSKM